MTDEILAELARTLESRRNADPAGSYTASLMAAGDDAILRKVGEEATEVLLAATARDDGGLVHEVADLWFHTLVLLAHRGLGPDDVLAELARRSGVSGLEEKASRGK